MIDLETAETAVDQAAVRYDRQGDQHYDVTSAFIKSVRGSDADAALHYLARMMEAGEDPRFIARRLIILASEDIGLADPTALTTAVAAAQAVQLIGMPEARLNLAQATIALAVAPKSNAVIKAIDAASTDVRAGKIGSVPPHLRDAHYSGAKALGHGKTLHLQPRRALRHRRAAVRARRRPRRGVLPADGPRCRGGGQGAVGAHPATHPWQVGFRTVNEWDVSTWLVVGACALVPGDGARAAPGAVASSRRELASTRAEAADLRRRIDELERSRADFEAPTLPAERVMVPTPIEDPVTFEPAPIEGRLFADLVLRESVVKAASWAHGVRRALSPENRNRIRFEMRREVKRSRKARRVEMQEALRAHRARARANESEDAA